MFALTLIMTCLLGYQVMMPQVNNAKYSFAMTPEGAIVRMNTQDGTMVRCDQKLKCEDKKDD